MARLFAGLCVWWVIVLAAGFVGSVLLQQHAGMPGPLLPGQERPEMP